MQRILVLRGILILVVILFESATLSAQNGYKLDFQLTGLKDTTVYLGYYYGDGTYIKDTARVNDTGKIAFMGTETLPPGVYFLVLNRSRLFDFLVSGNQHFSISANNDDYLSSLKAENSTDNTVFFNYMSFMIQKGKEIQPYRTILADSTANESKKVLANETASKINEEVRKYQLSIIEEHSELLASDYIRAQLPNLQLNNADASNDEKLNYFILHYWDNFDISNESLLRYPQPIYRQKIEYYFEKLHKQDPDILIKAIKEQIDKAKTNAETYKYLVWSLTQTYQYPKLMGLDKIYVYLYDTYFATGEMDYWANDNLKSTLEKRAFVLRNTLIGNTAPNLIIENISHKPSALYDLKSKYSIIYFYDPDCGFCKKETPKLRDFVNTTHRDVKVYAVCADSSLVKMNEYIGEMEIDNWINVNGPRTFTEHYQKIYDAATTPTIYLLDEKKKIIAKKIPADQIKPFLDSYESTLTDSSSE